MRNHPFKYLVDKRMQGPQGKNQLRISEARKNAIVTAVHLQEVVKWMRSEKNKKTGEDPLGPAEHREELGFWSKCKSQLEDIQQGRSQLHG